MDLLRFYCFHFALLLSLLFILPHHSISHAAGNNQTPATDRESILQCLAHRSVPRSVIFSPQSQNFSAVFSSPFQNQRVIQRHGSPKPLLIVTPTHESHAQAVVICCRQHDLQLRTRSGGHDFEGLSYSSTFGPFLILDLINLRSISFDLRGYHSTAWVQSGATLGELYYAIGSKSKTLAFPAGICSTIGVGGHISGGGVGPFMRAHGIASDNMVDVRIINADGKIIQRDSMGEDFFWALRGGGGASFGVILAYKIKLVEVPPKVTIFNKILNYSQGATRALAQWQQVAYRADNRLYINSILTASNKTVQVIFNTMFLGEMKELLPILEESFPDLRVSSKDYKEKTWIEAVAAFSIFPLSDTNGVPLSRLLDRSHSEKKVSVKTKSDTVTVPIAEQSWDKIWKYLTETDELPAMYFGLEPLGGKVSEVAETETPFPHRNESKFMITYFMEWPEAGEKEAKRHIDWLRKVYKFMTPFVSNKPRAAYLNARDLDLGRNREGMISYDGARVWGNKYFKDNFKRLALAKAKADPDNFFKNEQSIPLLFHSH